MKTVMMSLALAASLPLALCAQVSKEEIKKLAAAGISDEVIVSYVRANGGISRLSAEDLVDLKQAGASEKLLSSLLGSASPAPKAAPAPMTPGTPPVEGSDNVPYAAPAASSVVYDSNPYYYTPTYSYYGGYYPYAYPSYYYSVGFPWYWNSPRYCSRGIGFGCSTGHFFSSSRGFVGGGIIRHR